MSASYSVSPTCSTLQTCENRNQVTRTSNVSKNIAVSLFAGTVLLATSFSGLSGGVRSIGDYSPAVNLLKSQALIKRKVIGRKRA